MNEAEYQSKLIKKIRNLLPGCVILKNDANYLQGIPDLSIFYKDKYALLEVKKSADEPHRPNQDYYIEKFETWTYAAFIFPENEKEVLDELQSALQPRR